MYIYIKHVSIYNYLGDDIFVESIYINMCKFQSKKWLTKKKKERKKAILPGQSAGHVLPFILEVPNKRTLMVFTTEHRHGSVDKWRFATAALTNNSYCKGLILSLLDCVLEQFYL